MAKEVIDLHPPEKLISFVIPCYASEESVGSVIAEIKAVMADRAMFDYQIVAVNDCSPDGVWEVLLEECDHDGRIVAVDLAKNGGRHNALMCGCRYAQGDYIVFVDDDQQCPMDCLWELLEPVLHGGYDVAIARYPEKQQAVWKNLGSSLNDRIANWILEKDKDLKFSNFSVMKAFVKDEVMRYTNPYPYLSGIILRSTSRVCNVDMEERARKVGVGHYSFRKSLSLWTNCFTSFSVKPLRLATFIGFLLAVLGFAFGVSIVVRKFVIPSVPTGYSSIMAVLLLIGGMLMLMIGLVGEYVGRIYMSLNNSPQYVIREVVSCGDSRLRQSLGAERNEE